MGGVYVGAGIGIDKTYKYHKSHKACDGKDEAPAVVGQILI